METDSDTRPPPEGFYELHPEYRWPAWKFGMDMDELFTSLPQRFNRISLPLLDREAFAQDVVYLSHLASDKESFFQMLHERKVMREQELRRLWAKSFRQICGQPSLIGKGLWPQAMFIHRYNSYDSLVRFFADFVPPRDGDSLPSPPASTTACEHKPSTMKSSNQADRGISQPTIPPTPHVAKETNLAGQERPAVSMSSRLSDSSVRIRAGAQRHRLDMKEPRRSRRLQEQTDNKKRRNREGLSTRAGVKKAVADRLQSGRKRGQTG